jgi:hypothetical protein
MSASLISPWPMFLQQGAAGGNAGAGAQPGGELGGVVVDQAVQCFDRQ